MMNFKSTCLKTGIVAGIASFGLMACSNVNSDSVAGHVEDFQKLEPVSSVLESSGYGQVSVVNQSVALARVSACARSVVSAWDVDEVGGTLTQELDESFSQNSFGVEAEAVLEVENGYMTLASAGVDGDQDAWALRVENGKAMFAWRDASTGNQWYKVEAEGVLVLNEVITVRAERIDNLTVLYVNGGVVAAASCEASISTLSGHFTIGFDPSVETENIPGHVVIVRFGVVRHIANVEEPEELTLASSEPVSLDPVAAESSSSESSDPLPVEESSSSSAEDAEFNWIAAWEFDDPENVGKDYTGNGHTAKAGEGSVTVSDDVAHFDGKSGFVVDLDGELKINNFVVEARVKPTKFSSMQNILVAEPPGCFGDGWMLRVDDGTLTVHFRDASTDYTEWNVFTGKDLVLDEWTDIRLERSKDHVKLFQNGELTVDVDYAGDVSQLTYDWGVGYDAMNQSFHTRYFQGDIDYIRFGALDAAGSVVSDPVVPAEKSSLVLLADWEFNEPAFPGLDKMGNNSPKSVSGDAKVVDGSLVLDGKSGISLGLSSTFRRNEFAVDVRMMPTAFSDIQNVFVAEPPGRYGDGWMIRVDKGVLTVHLRDEATHGVEWQVFKGKALALDQWTEVRVVREAGSIKVYQDGELTIDAKCEGDVSQLGYDLGIGYDAVYQAYHNRFFVGSIDYIRYYGIRK